MSDKEVDRLFGWLCVVGLPGLLVWGGFVLSHLWLWFIVPLGLRPVSIMEAAGIDLLITYVAPVPPPQARPHEIFARAICKPGIFLGVGWLVSRFL